MNALEITQTVSASAVSAKIGKTVGKIFVSKKTSKGNSTGWQVESVDRTGKPALTISYRVYTPAEVAKVSFNTHSYTYKAEQAKEQMPVVIDALISAGYIVTPAGGFTFYVSK
jgi:hypothetical protein